MRLLPLRHAPRPDLPVRPRAARPRRGPDFFESFEAPLAPARAGEVDVVLHAGDLLYRSRVPAWLSDAALAPLRAVADGGIPVLLLPGNHERGQLPHPLLALQRNLHVFDRPRTVVLEAGGVRVAFAGFPHERDVRDRFCELLAAATAGAPAVDVKLLCLHRCVEGATCGPGDFTFRDGPDVIPRSALPPAFEAVLCGHIHRHQVLRAPGLPPVSTRDRPSGPRPPKPGRRRGSSCCGCRRPDSSDTSSGRCPIIRRRRDPAVRRFHRKRYGWRATTSAF